jgi:alkyl hydroperoxide reductase subunit D
VSGAVPEVLSLETLLAGVPDYAKDLRLNLSAVLKQSELTEQQAWGTAVAAAIASRNPQLTGAIFAEAAQHLSPENMRAAKAAASIMGMNNVYYRFLHLTPNQRYREIPARLRMQVIRGHGGDPVDFELWCLAVSAINACPACVESHEHVLRDKGVTEETILAAVRIASVVHALAAVIGVE